MVECPGNCKWVTQGARSWILGSRDTNLGFSFRRKSNDMSFDFSWNLRKASGEHLNAAWVPPRSTALIPLMYVDHALWICTVGTGSGCTINRWTVAIARLGCFVHTGSIDHHSPSASRLPRGLTTLPDLNFIGDVPASSGHWIGFRLFHRVSDI
jgi:hypothetical protein